MLGYNKDMGNSWQASKNNISERQRELLMHAIQSYIQLIRPITSAPLASQFSLSSATVRNELARLEDTGYLIQPHTSSGRLPTEKAYRMLVTDLLQSGVDVDNQRELIAELLDRVEHEINILINSALILISELTGQLAWSNYSNNFEYQIRSLEIIELDSTRVILALSLTYSKIKTRAIEVQNLPSRKLIQYIVDSFNSEFAGRSIHEIDLNRINDLFSDLKINANELIEKLTVFLTSVYLETGNVLNFTAAEKLISQPEFQDASNKAVEILATLSRSELPLQANSVDNNNTVATQIGSDNLKPELKEASVIFANYQMGDRTGQIGIIGPLRMDYKLILPIVAATATCLNSLFE